MGKLGVILTGAALLVLLGPTPLRAQEQAPAKPPAVKHDLQGREACLMCHKAGAMEAVPDVPENHGDRTNETCLWCHGPESAMQTATPPAIPHDLTGREACLMCHKPGAMAAIPDAPADHEGRKDTSCTLCHKPAPGA